MGNIDNTTIENCRKLREACLANAEELVNSAKLLKGKSTAHIRYHLAVLAIEEVGKAGIFLADFVSAKLGKDDREINYSIDNHVKKLFWAIFSPFIEYERMTKEGFESYKGLAKEMHERRLETLYTDTQNPLLPQDRVSEEEADHFVRLSESRINIEKGVDISETPDESKLEDLRWFLGTSDDTEKRQFIFSNLSLDKLADLKDMYKWIKWLRREFTKSEEETRKILQQEMEKGLIEGDEGNEQKWKVKFRIFSTSHSIRQKALNAWNSQNDFIMNLKKSNNSNELICEFTLPKSVHLHALWDTAHWRCRYFVAALNIATKGLFWWHVDKDLDRFYEKIWDLENDAEARPRISPKLSLDWGHLTLTEEDFRGTRFIFGYILKDFRLNTRKREALETYLTGLALISKIDIHLRLEPNAFAHFFMALKTLLLATGDWDGVEDFKQTVETQLREGFSTMPGLNEYIELGMRLERGDSPFKRITLTEVIGMKLYCDVYFSLLVKREFDRHRNSSDSGEE